MEVKPGYKRTEVGVIPEEWHIVPLKDIAETSSGTTPSRSLLDRYFRQGRNHWVKTLDLNNSELWATDECVTDVALAETSLRIYPIGTVLIAMYGGFNQIGRTGLLRIPAAVNQAITAVQPDATLFPAYLLTTLNFRVEHWKSVASSSRKDPNITSQDIREFPIPLPPLAEQRAIATALSDADALLTQLDRLIAKKRDIKQAAMQQLLTGKTRLPGFGEEWEPCAFDEVLERLNVKAHQLQTADYQTVGRYPVVDQGQQPVVGYSDDSKRRFLCPSGGVVVFGDHTCVVKFVDFDFLVGADGTQVLQARPGHSTRFLAYELQREGIQQTGYNRHFKFLKDRRFKMPHLAEQTAIATLLSDLDAELAALEARRDKTRALKQGMMQELLTGRTRLI